MCISLNDRDANKIHTVEDLDRYKPGTLDKFKDWLKRYKTSDGKPENNLASEIPRSAQDSMKVVEENHGRWKALCGRDGTSMYSLEGAEDFWLKSPECRGY